MVPSEVATKRVVFDGPVFIYRNVDEGAHGCIMLEVDTIWVTELVSLSSCTGAGSGTVTSGGAAVDAAWGLWGWADGCDRGCNKGLLLSCRHCCNLLYELLEKDVHC